MANDQDRHIRRDGSDYAVQFLALMPTGQAWPRAPDSTLARTCNGLNEYWGFVDGRAGDLLEIESDPRKTSELLSDWERAWGLPDPCFPPAVSEDERRAMLVFKLTLLGGQSKQFFEQISNWSGHQIFIKELSPWMCGISEVGDTRYEYDDTGAYRWYLGPPEMRYYWSIGAETAVLDWFRCGYGGGECGVDPHLRINTEVPLDCLLQRWKPAHTELVFDYSALQDMGPMAGTP